MKSFKFRLMEMLMEDKLSCGNSDNEREKGIQRLRGKRDGVAEKEGRR